MQLSCLPASTRLNKERSFIVWTNKIFFADVSAEQQHADLFVRGPPELPPHQLGPPPPHQRQPDDVIQRTGLLVQTLTRELVQRQRQLQLAHQLSGIADPTHDVIGGASRDGGRQLDSCVVQIGQSSSSDDGRDGSLRRPRLCRNVRMVLIRFRSRRDLSDQ